MSSIGTARKFTRQILYPWRGPFHLRPIEAMAKDPQGLKVLRLFITETEHRPLWELYRREALRAISHAGDQGSEGHTPAQSIGGDRDAV